MRNHKGCAGFQSVANLTKCFKPLVDGDMVESEQANGGIEWTFRRGIYAALMKTNTAAMLAGNLPRQFQHVGGGVDAIKSPARMRLGKCLEFQSATGAEHKHAAFLRHPLRHQHRRHPMQA